MNSRVKIDIGGHVERIESLLSELADRRGDAMMMLAQRSLSELEVLVHRLLEYGGDAVAELVAEQEESWRSHHVRLKQVSEFLDGLL